MYFFHSTIIYEERYSSKVWRRKWKKILDVYVLPFAGEKGKVRRSVRERNLIRTVLVTGWWANSTSSVSADSGNVRWRERSQKNKRKREREREKRATRPSWWPWKNNFSNSLSLLYGCGQLQQHLTTEATPATHAVMAVAILAFSPPPSLLPIRYGSLLHSKPATRSSVKEKKKQKKKRNKNKCNLESDRYLPEFFKSTAGSWNKTNPWRYAYCCVRI